MNKTNIKCPRCHSNKLYKFGLDKQANQKYQCRQCKRQFALGDGDRLPKMNYPKCPKCGKGTYLHHSYKYYNRYKCNNKKCNHIIVKHHTTNIDDASSKLVTGALSTSCYINCTNFILSKQFVNKSYFSILNDKFRY